jgi:hypothetical protein
MPKPSRQEKQHQRAKEQLDKGLRRGDLPTVLSALTSLPASEQAREVPKVAPIFRQALETEVQSGGAAGLFSLARSARAVPALVESGADPASAAGVYWKLLWAAVSEQEAALIEPLLARFEALLGERGRVLSRAVRAAADPGPLDEELSALLSRLPAGARPLARSSKKAPLPPPAEGAEQEALFRLYAEHPFEAIGAHLTRWAPHLSEPSSRVLHIAASRLAVREILLSLESGAGSLAGPVSLFLLAAEPVATAPELDAVMLLMTRLGIQAIQSDRAQEAPLVDALPSALLWGAKRAAWRSMLSDAAVGLPLDKLTGSKAFFLLDGLLALEPRVETLIEVVKRWDSGDKKRSRRPPSAAMKKAVESLGPGAFPLEKLLALPEPSHDPLLYFLGRYASAPLVTSVFEASFAHADDSLKQSLARMLTELLARSPALQGQMRSQALSRFEPDLLDDVTPFMREVPRGRDRIVSEVMRLAPPALTFDQELLDLLLFQATDEERTHLVEAAIERASTFEHHLSVCSALTHHDHPTHADELLRNALARFGNDLDALVAGVLWCVSDHAPPEVAVPLAKALENAHDAHCDGNHTPELDAALHAASVFSSFTGLVDEIQAMHRKTPHLR